MLRLSKKTDYALLALQYLASEAPSGVASARAIAQRFDIPLEVLAKVLQQLAHHQLVAAHKGMHGGYHLARPSSAISVADVVHALDGPVTLTACSATDVQCDQFIRCTVRDPLWRVRERILSILQTVTLADIAEREDGGRVLITVSRGEPGTAVPVHAR
jgi:Rrf2 family protein